ncbi:uncharacterized protein LOC142234188 [Haematobia irritans]|uniref:uncharacterized protein LOC142234188 n=1 Tax=Haematobia irritans TaxID=7368 RepID=UPI003F4F4B8E
MLERKPKLNVVSFEPLGEHISLGLDFLLPFIKVPIAREVDIYGNEPALININTAALISTGILAASSAFVSYLFRSYVMFEPMGKSEKAHRSDSYNFENEILSMMQYVKVIYKNSTGAKTDTTLTGLLSTIDEAFAQKDIDLSTCLQKALCQRIKQSNSNAKTENNYEATSHPTSSMDALDKIIDGLASLKWFRRNILRYTSLNDIIADSDELMATTTNRHQNTLTCDEKYPRCKWPMSGNNVGNLLGTYLKFI